MFLTGIRVGCDNENGVVLSKNDFYVDASVKLLFSDGTWHKFSSWYNFLSMTNRWEDDGVSGISVYNNSIVELAVYTKIEDDLVRLLDSDYRTTFSSAFGDVLTLPQALKVGIVAEDMSDECSLLFSKYCMMG